MSLIALVSINSIPPNVLCKVLSSDILRSWFLILILIMKPYLTCSEDRAQNLAKHPLPRESVERGQRYCNWNIELREMLKTRLKWVTLKYTNTHCSWKEMQCTKVLTYWPVINFLMVMNLHLIHTINIPHRNKFLMYISLSQISLILEFYFETFPVHMTVYIYYICHILWISKIRWP